MDGLSGGLRVWITRTQPGATRTATRLAALGHKPLIAPLIEARPLPAAEPDPAEVDALAFTSTAAVERVSQWGAGFRTKPVFAVGNATADAARRAGFATVTSAAGDGAALATLLTSVLPKGVRLLHPAAASPAYDLQAALSGTGRCVRTLAVYETLAVGKLPATAEHALASGMLGMVLVHSPAAARALATLLPPAAAASLTLAALSPACMAPLADLPFAARRVADRPDEAALMDTLSALRPHAAPGGLGNRPPPR